MLELVVVPRDAAHVLLHDLLRRVADEEVEPEDEHAEIVELPDDRDEVRNDVEREHEVAGDRAKDELLLCRHTRIACESPDEPGVRRHLAHHLDGLFWVAGRTELSSHAPLPAGIVPAALRRPRRRPPLAPPSRTRPCNAPCRRKRSAAPRSAAAPSRPAEPPEARCGCRRPRSARSE